MAESLIDLGQMTNQALQLAQLAQYQRLNDTRQARQQEDAKLQTIHQRNDLLKNKLIEGTDGEIELLQSQFQDLGFRVPPREELMAGRRAHKRLINALLDPDIPLPEKQRAYMDSASTSPSLTKQALEIAKGMDDFDVNHLSKLTNLQKNEYQVRQLNTAQQQAELRQNIYSTTGGMLNTLADAVNIKDPGKPSSTFSKTFQSALNAKDPKEKERLLGMIRGYTAKFDSERLAQANAASEQFNLFREKYGPIVEQVKHAQAMKQPVSQDQLEIVKAMEIVDQADYAVQQWNAKPYEKGNWQQLQNAIQQVNSAASLTKRTMTGIDAQRQALFDLKLSQDERKVLEGQAQSFMQESFLDYLNQGMKDNAAAAKAIAETRKKYGQSVALNAKDLTNLEKKAPAVEIHNYNEKQNVGEAGKLANLNQAISELQQVRGILIDPDGSVNRTNLATGALGVPFTEGRSAEQFVRKAVEIKLRAATGAAARKDEIKLYAELFGPSIKDSDDLIKYKIDSFENWMQTVADTTDPQGSLRQRADLLMDKGTISLLSTPEYKELRNKFPQASTSDIVRFLQNRKK